MDAVELERLDWEALGRVLTTYARRCLGRGGSHQDAEDAAERAVETLCKRVLDGQLADLPVERQIVLSWLAKTVKLQVWNDARTKSRAFVQPFDDGTDVENVGDQVPGPEEHLLLKRRSAAVRDAILDRISADELAGDVFMLGLDGIDTAAAQAARLGKPVGEVYKARERLERHYRHVLTQLQDEIDHG